MSDATVSAQFLKALLEKVANPDISAVIENLPEEMKERFQNLPDKAEKPFEKFFISPKDVLDALHSSWHEELVPFVAEELRPLMRRVLLEKEESALRSFLLSYLVNKWPDKDLPDVKEAKETPLSFLLDSDEGTVAQLQELIVVHDIVDEVRQVVDRRRLQQILQKLSLLQQKYLRSQLHRSTRPTGPNLGLVGLLKQEPQKASEMLQRRGEERFACALKGEPAVFLWYFFHRMDRHAALKLQTAMEMEASTVERAQAKKHLVEAFRFLQARSTA
jgi:hypothetical protein